MSDKWSRTVRTLIQVGVIQVVLQVYQAFAPVPLNDTQYAALTTAGTVLLTLAQNWIEETSGVALLKSSDRV